MINVKLRLNATMVLKSEPKSSNAGLVRVIAPSVSAGPNTKLKGPLSSYFPPSVMDRTDKFVKMTKNRSRNYHDYIININIY